MKMNHDKAARTKWMTAMSILPWVNWHKSGMKKLHKAARTLPPEPRPATSPFPFSYAA